MADGTVGWHFFDTESGSLPEEFSPSTLPGGGAGRIVALAATPFAQSDGWATKAVVAIAKGWAGENLRIFLMDLGLDAPSLHEALGLLNREGVSDAFLYGASVQRIAQPALDETIFFAPAGTATNDPEQILGHPRWKDLAGGFSEADATLLLFLPTDIPGAEKIMSRATDVLFLAGEGESAEGFLGPAAVKVVATMGPSGTPPSSPGEEVVGSGPEEPESGFPAEGVFGLSGDLPMGDESGSGSPDLDLEEGLSLAEGFMRETEPEDDQPSDFIIEGSSIQDEEGSGLSLSDDFVQESTDLTPAGEEEPTLAAEFAERVEQDGAESGDQGGAAKEVPDFGAEFAAMPPLEHEVEEGSPPAMVPGEIVSGSEFTPDQLSGADQSDPGAPEEELGGEPPGDDGRRRPPQPSDRRRPPSKRRPPPKRRFSIPMVASSLAAVALLTSAVGTAAGVFNVPGFGWLQGMFAELPYPDLQLAGDETNEAFLEYSLELDVYGEDELGLAIEMRNALRERMPHLLFYLTPMSSGEVVSYALYAGPATDPVDVENLRASISEVITREDPETWPVRVTPLAFYLGGRGTLQEAQEYLASAEGSGALGYILHVTYPDSTEAYEILSGAYQGTEDARWWQLALRESGFRDIPLIQRRGSPPE